MHVDFLLLGTVVVAVVNIVVVVVVVVVVRYLTTGCLYLLLLRSILLDAVHPRDGLLHRLRVEPAVGEDDVVGRGDVEPDAARVDGREEHLPRTVAASATYGCSLCHLRLQPLSHMVAVQPLFP